ncbi:glycosyltransferase family 2 protein [Roseobacter sp. YSTF-M11]|uniref:Glycosyltransferase family 2 protein n=1 Tax=Roseobacter insulae TaxID=2859783 RepID=A0A9X1FVQ9_9RHOB|nr:glycosyltransferase family 2 protein [Roseobacter insulae]MBW4707980.1 glycosyltransferase family 2 protein [Roseobacter insulae]
MRITAVTCVKNEGPFLLEWIAFNRLIGVTDFLFYSNDCTDGTDALLDVLADKGMVHHLPNPAQGRTYQMAALKDASGHPVVTAADWVWVADVDEFLNIHAGDHTIPALVAACGDPMAISVTFQFFANNGVADYLDHPVIGQFSHSHNPDLWCGETAIEVKTLMRRDFPLQYFGAHRPFFKKKLPADQRPRWTDGSGRPVPHRFQVAANSRRIRRYPARGARDFATLNHYALRSLDSYLVKHDRGDVNRAHRAFDTSYWQDRNDPAWQDTSIMRYAPALDAALRELKADKTINAQHEACVRSHKAKCAELMARPDMRALRAALQDAPALPPQEIALLAALGAPV